MVLTKYPELCITFIPLISGSLGVFGSSAIMYNIFSDPQRRFQTPYFRIMFCLSLADMIYAINKMVSIFAIPKGTKGDCCDYLYASGNQATCRASGFLNQLGMIQPLYTSSLCIYFWLVIKYGKADEYIRKRAEPWMHTLSVGIPLICAILGLCLGLYKPSVNGCNLASKKHHAWLFLGSVIFISFTVIIYTMMSVVLFVRQRERITNRRMSFTTANTKVQVMSQRIIKKKKEVMTQAVLYVSAYVLVYAFGITAKFCFQYQNYCPWVGLIAFNQIFNPMQGFLNFIIYFLPRYTKVKEEHKDKSLLWLLREAIVTKTRDKVQRRATLMQRNVQGLVLRQDVGHTSPQDKRVQFVTSHEILPCPRNETTAEPTPFLDSLHRPDHSGEEEESDGKDHDEFLKLNGQPKVAHVSECVYEDEPTILLQQVLQAQKELIAANFQDDQFESSGECNSEI